MSQILEMVVMMVIAMQQEQTGLCRHLVALRNWVAKKDFAIAIRLTRKRQLEHAKMVDGLLFSTNSSASLQFNQLLEIALGVLQMINQQVVTQLQAYVVAPETLRLHYGL
jgi:hypothetical protein